MTRPEGLCVVLSHNRLVLEMMTHQVLLPWLREHSAVAVALSSMHQHTAANSLNLPMLLQACPPLAAAPAAQAQGRLPPWQQLAACATNHHQQHLQLTPGRALHT